MKNAGTRSDAEILRQKVEELLKKKQSQTGTQASESETLKLIHELEVHQIELEMQNDELILARRVAQDAAAKYIELYEFAPSGYFTLSREGKIIELNLRGSQILGKEKTHLRNSLFGFFVSGDTKSIFNLFLGNIFNSKAKESCEVALSPDGSSPTYIYLTGIITENEKQCLVTAVDITEQREALEQLKQKSEQLEKANAEKDKFFSILSHDLRSPLSSFIGFTKILSEKLPEMNQKEIQEIADTLKKTSTSIYLLVVDLLEWSVLQRGLADFNPVPAPLIEVVNRSTESLSDLARQKNLEIQLQVPENLFVKVDQTMLESTLRNLLSNAVKFSFRGEKIVVSARVAHDNFVEIAISDTGVGMSPEILGNLFQMNAETGHEGTEGEPSTGLGLMLCREFVEKHGGKIHAESNEMKGSTFRFTVPGTGTG
jgi:nitrogen-specific signal transduction histidine kinase